MDTTQGIVLHWCAHSWPLSSQHNWWPVRLGIRAAVAALLAQEPRTLVVIRLANTEHESVYGSDWKALQVNWSF